MTRAKILLYYLLNVAVPRTSAGLQAPFTARTRFRRALALDAAQTVGEHVASDPRHTAAMREEVVVAASLTVGECVQRVRAAPPSWSRIGRVWVIGADGVLAGFVGATQLLLAAPEAPISTLAQAPEELLRSDEDLDAALARVVRKGGSNALPVVDGRGALVGARAARVGSPRRGRGVDATRDATATQAGAGRAHGRARAGRDGGRGALRRDGRG